MKKLLAKIRNKRLKGNISLLVIIILLASSVISLLSINQIQRLITYGNQTFNYFRAFYLAKAGTELGLTEVYHREAGFEHTVNSGDVIVSSNLVGIYTGFDPYFTMNISGNFLNITNDIRHSDDCSGDNKITLGTGEGIVISLFRDNPEEKYIISDYTGGIEKLKKDDIGNIRIKDIKPSNEFKEFMFGLFDYDDAGNMNNIVVQRGKGNTELESFISHNIDTIVNKRSYLTIKNPGFKEETVSFCVNMNGKGLVPYSDSLITVFGHYGDMEVGIQSIVKKGVPSWALNLSYGD